MDNNDLGYMLYMESCDLQSKDYEELSEDEKVNLELNPFLVADIPTKDRNRSKS